MGDQTDMTSLSRGKPLMVAVIGLTSLCISMLGFVNEMVLLIVGALGLIIVLTRPIFGVLILLTTFLMTYPSFLRGVGRITPNNVLGGILSILLIIRFLKEESLWFLRVRQVQILAGIGLVFILSTALAPDSPAFIDTADRTAKELWDFFALFAFMIFLIHFVEKIDHLRLVLGLLLIAILATIPSALYTTFLGSGDYRAAATLGISMAKNSNHLAFYCLFGMVMLLYMYKNTRSSMRRVLIISGIGILLLGVILSASRNALLNLIFLTIILAAEVGIDLRKIAGGFLLIAFIVFAAWNILPKENMERMTVLGVDPTQKEASQSFKERRRSLEVGLKMFLDSNPLLGLGPGNHRWKRQLEYDHKRVATHNAYLWAILSGGIPVLLLYLLLFRVTWKDLRWMESRAFSPGLPPRWMISSLRTVLLLFLLFSLFTDAWLEVIPFLLVGLTIVMKRIHLLHAHDSAPDE